MTRQGFQTKKFSFEQNTSVKSVLFAPHCCSKPPFHYIRGIEPRTTPTPKVGACLRPNAVAIIAAGVFKMTRLLMVHFGPLSPIIEIIRHFMYGYCKESLQGTLFNGIIRQRQCLAGICLIWLSVPFVPYFTSPHTVYHGKKAANS